MHDKSEESTFSFQRLDCYRAAREMAVKVHEAKIEDAELRDQATRASKSCFLNLSEGLPSEAAGTRRKFFSSAIGSACETAAAVDLACAIGAVTPDAAREILILAVRVKRMLRGLR